MIKPRYYLQTEAIGCSSSIGLNTVPIMQDKSGKGSARCRIVNEWIHPGKNTLDLFLSWPSGKPFEKGTASVSATLFIADPQSPSPMPGTVVVSAVYPLPAVAGIVPPEAYPMRLTIPFSVENIPQTQLWEAAEPIAEVTPAHVTRMIEIANQLSAAIAEGKSDEAFSLVGKRYNDEEVAQYLQPGDLRPVLRKQYSFIASWPNVSYIPLKPQDATVKQFADGRVLLLERVWHADQPSGGTDAVQLTSDLHRLSLPLYFAQFDKRLEIIR